MASYVDSSLTEGENVRYEGKVSLWSLSPRILLGLLFLVYGFGLMLLVWAAITYFTTELAVTNKRVIAKIGFIRRKAIDVNITNVESIKIKQGILGRIFNFGSIQVSGAGIPQVRRIPKISNPIRFKKRCFEVQEEGKSGPPK
jgi:uncharacterized membrane protein YdbT with pleckstrin-like domain